MEQSARQKTPAIPTHSIQMGFSHVFSLPPPSLNIHTTLFYWSNFSKCLRLHAFVCISIQLTIIMRDQCKMFCVFRPLSSPANAFGIFFILFCFFLLSTLATITTIACQVCYRVFTYSVATIILCHFCLVDFVFTLRIDMKNIVFLFDPKIAENVCLCFCWRACIIFNFT